MKATAENGLVVTEHAVVKHPGWTRIEYHAPDGSLKNTRYRAPGGTEMSKRQAGREMAATGTTGHTGTTRNIPQENTHPVSARLYTPDPVPALEVPPPEPIPVKVDGGKAGGQASAGQAAVSFAMVLLILTSLTALMTATPELAMTEQEATGIAGPAGNIFARSSLNKRFGHFVAESGDLTALGYGLYAYAYRVGSQLSARHQQEAQQAPRGATPAMTQRGVPIHAVPQAAQPGPIAPNGATRQGAGDIPAPAAQPAAGGIAGAINGNVPAESSRLVGYSPIADPRGAA